MAAEICISAANPCLSFLEEKEPLSHVPKEKLSIRMRTVNMVKFSRPPEIPSQCSALKLAAHSHIDPSTHAFCGRANFRCGKPKKP